MNFNKLSRLSPFIRVLARHADSSKTLNKINLKCIPIRCLASGSQTKKSIPLRSFEEELTKQKEEHGREDWGNFIKVSWQIGIVFSIGCVAIAYFCFSKSIYMVIEFDTQKLALDDTKDLNIDQD